EEPSADRLIITYKSRRKLCLFMEGLIDGVADYYSSPITYEQRICMLDGGEVCEFDLAYSPEGRSAS
ncbi:MAG: heme NO-binding domain-containing protein, partial [Thermodesulfobacteriota bacterium]